MSDKDTSSAMREVLDAEAPPGLVIMTGPSRQAQGGVAAVARLLVEGLRGARPDLPIRYIATTPPGASKSRRDKLGSALRAYTEFLRIMAERGKRTTIVHVHLGAGWDTWRNLVFVLIAALGRHPVVCHVHAAWAFAGYARSHPLGRAALRLLRPTASVILVPSPRAARELGRLLPNSDTRVLTNAVDTRQYGAHPLPRRDQLVVYLGWLINAKGVLDLLDAFQLVRGTCQEARMLMAGPYGAERMAYEVRVRGLADVVDLTPWVSGVEKRELLARSRVLALPSYTEGMPIVLLEALASGLPVVTTPVGGIPDVVTHGVSGLLVAPGDVAALAASLELLLTDDAEWAAMSEASLESARGFDAAVAVTRLARLYDELVAS